MRLVYILISILFSILHLSAQNLNWVYKTGGLDMDYGTYVDVGNDQSIIDATIFTGEATISNTTKFTSRGSQDILIRKSNQSGIFQWATQIGSKKQDIAYQVKFDNNLNVYVLGYASDSVFVNRQFAFKAPSNNITGFIIKLKANGSFDWYKSLESTESSEIRSLAFHKDGNPIITGHFQGSTNFEVSFTTPITIESKGGNDFFIQKISADFGQSLWLRTLGDVDQDYAYDLAIDTSDNIIIVGEFKQNCDFNPGTEVNALTSKGLNDAFVLKLNKLGNFQWVRSYGGPSFDLCRSISTHNNEIIIGGNFNGLAILDSNNKAYQSNGNSDIFISKLREDGTSKWVNVYGDSQNDALSIIKKNTDGIIFAGGVFRGKIDLNTDPFFTNSLTSNGGADLFILTLNQDGTYSDHIGLGSQVNDQLYGIAPQVGSNLIISGGFGAVMDFDPSSSDLNILSSGNIDGFLVSIYECIAPHIETLEAESSNICFGDRAIIRVKEGHLNGAISWSWSRDSCNALSFASGSFINPKPTSSITYYVKGVGGCVQNSLCQNAYIYVFTDTLKYNYAEICQGDTLKVGNSFYTSRGVFTDSLISVTGCDSTIITELNVLPSYSKTNRYDICPGEVIRVGNSEYSINGDFTNIFTASNGCDSIIISQVRILPTTITNTEATICEGETIKIGDVVYSNSGTYLQNSQAPNGCDDVLIIKINTLKTQFFVDTILCEGNSYNVGNKAYTKAGVYIDTLQSSLGCDSIILSNVTFRTSITKEIEIILCAGDTIFIGSSAYTDTGNFIDVLTRVNGCDSIVMSNIRKVPKPIALTRFLTLCEGENITVGNNQYSESGDYVDTLSTQNGCDSFVTTYLRIVKRLNTINQTICQGEAFVFSNDTLRNAGSYTFNFKSSNDCDSIIILNLSVFPKIVSQFKYAICPGDTINVFGYKISNPTTLVDKFTSSISGCDSIREIIVDFNHSTTKLTHKLCSGESIEINGKIYKESGIFSDKITRVDGCDSLLNIEIEVIPAIETDTVFVICKGESINVGGNNYFNEGKFTEFLKARSGCDSIVNFEIEILNFIPQFYLEKDSLKTIIVPGATYQWLECINNDEVKLFGATNPFLKISKNGIYALEVTYQGCTFISTCIPIVLSSTQELNNSPIIFPNPSLDVVTINVDENTKIEINDAYGKNLIKTSITPSNNSISLHVLTSGTYYIKGINNNKTWTIKFIKL